MIRNHDLFVADNLTARLRGSGIPGLRAVDVTVDDRTATLDGSLSCFYEKQVCVLASALEPWKSITSWIRFRSQTTTTVRRQAQRRDFDWKFRTFRAALNLREIGLLPHATRTS